MMKKIISLLGIIMIFAVGISVLAGCGGNVPAGKTVESLTVAEKTILVAESAEDIKLTVRIKYADEDERAATGEDVEYASDNTQVATVSKDGVVTVTGVGSAKLTVKSKSGGATGEKLMETIDMTVVRDSSVVESLTVTGGTEQTATYKVDSTLQLETKIKYVGGAEKPATSADVTYVSSEPSIASVDSSGLVSIKAVGTTEITVSSIYNNVSGAKVVKVITLSVAEAPLVTESLTLTSEKSYSVIRGIYGYDPTKGYENDKTQIAFNVKYYYEDAARAGNSDEATYTSSDPDVASVSDGGEITFNAIGNCTITVTSKYKTMDGETVSVDIPVEVYKPTNVVANYKITAWEVDYYGSQTSVDLIIKNLTSEGIVIYETMYVCCLNTEGKVLDTLRFGGESVYIGANAEKECNFLIDKKDIPEGTAEMIIVKAWD